MYTQQKLPTKNVTIISAKNQVPETIPFINNSPSIVKT